MKNLNKLPPGYKNYLSLLVDHWAFIQALDREECKFIPTTRARSSIENEPVGDIYEFDIQYLKAKAMEEMMEFLPSPGNVDEIYWNTKQILEMKYEPFPVTHPMFVLAYGLFEKLLKRI